MWGRDNYFRVYTWIVSRAWFQINYEKEQSVLNDKIDNLYKTNEKLDYYFNKQKERLNNVQTQLNSTRNANTKLNETITSLEKQIKELLTHQSELKRGHIEQENMKRTTDSTFNEITESVKRNANFLGFLRQSIPYL
jgi:predicted nuclease with TOPRIM domain